MKLYYSPSSPYARKARLAVFFKNLETQVEQISCNPFNDAPEQSHQNPLGKVPTLVLDDGFTIFDSPVICEYLDRQSEHPRLYPGRIDEWIRVKTAEALADGILDAAYNRVMESRRDDSEQSASTIERWTTEILRALQQAEKTIASLDNPVSQAHIALYCALGYLDFRLPELEWRSRYPRIMPTWLTHFQQHYPFVLQTQPE